MLRVRRGTIIKIILLHNGIEFILGSVRKYITSEATMMNLDVSAPKGPCCRYGTPTAKAAS
jgi:hypothetical protein